MTAQAARAWCAFEHPGDRDAVAGIGKARLGSCRRLSYTVHAGARCPFRRATVMSVLIVYDGWQNLKFWAAVGVILGPVLAMFVSHVFSASLALQAELHRRPGRSEQLNIIRTESRFLLLAGSALALLAILTLAGVSLGLSIQAVIFLEGASLGFWGS
jgi:hypothetical protein